MKQLLATFLLIFSVLTSCGKTNQEKFVITPPNTHPGTTQTPSTPEEPGTPPEEPVTPAAPPDGYIIVGYVTYWGSTMPDPTYLTHINYAFGKIDSDFETLKVQGESRLKKIIALKQTHPNLKVCLSIGGWGAGNFSEMAASETHRKKFCQNCLAAVTNYGLDGIDLDWEYPTSSSAGISSSPDDTKNFTQLVKDLRAALGKDKLLTMASASNAKYVEFKDFIEQMNFVNLMTYDMGDPPYHNAGLYASSKTKRSCDESVTLHLNKGIPAEKIVLGMPFYGRDDNKAFTAGDDDNFVYYRDIVKGKYIEQWDGTAKVPYLTSGGTMVLSYDNETSIGFKADYVKQKGLKGAMYWAIEGDDDNWTLSKAIASRLIGWVAPEQPSEPEDPNAFLATNQYVQKYLEEVDYTTVIQQHPYGDDSNYGKYTLVLNYPGGGPSKDNKEIPPTYSITWTASSSAQKLTVTEGDWTREYSLSAGVGKQDITNLVPGTTYNWTVTTTSGSSVAKGSFKTRGKLHQVFFEPNVRNGRDLGGYKGLGGKTVAYHKIYRGGRVDGKYCNSTGRAEMLAEGIRAEIDLREADDVPKKSPIGDQVDFYAPGFDSGYNHMVRDNPEKVKNTFCWVVARLRENKPVYFHCAAGRDRTATLAILLEGVLGVSESDMAKDYELTYFTPADWGMSENGTAYKHYWDNYSYTSVRKTIFNQTNSGTYQERIEKYLLKIGVPQKDIDDLRNIMLK